MPLLDALWKNSAFESPQQSLRRCSRPGCWFRRISSPCYAMTQSAVELSARALRLADGQVLARAHRRGDGISSRSARAQERRPRRRRNGAAHARGTVPRSNAVGRDGGDGGTRRVRQRSKAGIRSESSASEGAACGSRSTAGGRHDTAGCAWDTAATGMPSGRIARSARRVRVGEQSLAEHATATRREPERRADRVEVPTNQARPALRKAAATEPTRRDRIGADRAPQTPRPRRR